MLWKLEFNLQPVVLSDNKTISCVICNLTDEVLSTDPETLKSEVIKQLVCTKTNEYSYRVGFILERWKVVIRTIVGCFELTRTGSILRRIFESCFMWYDVRKKNTLFEYRSRYRGWKIILS